MKIMLTCQPSNKIIAIKTVRTVTGLNLRPAINAIELGLLFDTYDQIVEFLDRFERAWKADEFVVSVPVPTFKVSLYTPPKAPVQIVFKPVEPPTQW